MPGIGKILSEVWDVAEWGHRSIEKTWVSGSRHSSISMAIFALTVGRHFGTGPMASINHDFGL